MILFHFVLGVMFGLLISLIIMLRAIIREGDRSFSKLVTDVNDIKRRNNNIEITQEEDQVMQCENCH